MKANLYIPVYAATLLVSAALLFSVQPMFSKMILPLLGGTPQVWNTAMLFFQVVLLAGYAYAHGTTKFLSIRVQAIVHIALLICFTVVLPLAIPESWRAPLEEDPTLWQLGVMASTIGGPFFVLAASAPMLQRWFANSDHPDANNPYFLYGASNLGSMTSLLAYPVVFEPLMNLSEQSNVWMYGYILLILMIAAAAILIWPHGKAATTSKKEKKEKDVAPVTWNMRIQWLILAFIPSSLMLGVTTYATTDIASAPMLWIIPLALYVGTFILVFSRKVYLDTTQLSFIQGSLVAVLILLLIASFGTHKFLVLLLHLTLFFVTAWLCHGTLAAKRPDKKHLTEFYLLMSTGGALGGIFNALIAPQIFTTAIEYSLVLALACFVRFWDNENQEKKSDKKEVPLQDKLFGPSVAFMAVLVALYTSLEIPFITLICALGVFVFLIYYIDKRWSFASIAAFALLLNPTSAWLVHYEVLHSERNFFGILRVFDDPEVQMRSLLHGTTTHGTQSLVDDYKYLNISYYSEFSPLNDVFSIYDNRSGKQNVAVLGLGTGATACFDKPGRHFDFFEIDPDVIKIAEDPEYFTYLSDCGTPYDIVLGDARMTIQDKEDEIYDIILLDVFSSDNIPVHVLTEEAIRTYLSKVKKDGVVIFHISNNYLDLEPVLAKTAENIGIPSYGHFKPDGILEDSEIHYYASHYFVMTHSESIAKQLKSDGWSEGITKKRVQGWTDQYSNILSVIGHDVAGSRARAYQEKLDKEEEKRQEAEADASPDVIVPNVE